MSHAPIPENELLHILAAVQEGECTKRRALECIAAAHVGNFRRDWLPPAEGYFGMDEMPMEVVKQLREQVLQRLPIVPSEDTIERMCAAATTARWQGRAAVGDACPPPPRHQPLSRDDGAPAWCTGDGVLVVMVAALLEASCVRS